MTDGLGDAATRQHRRECSSAGGQLWAGSFGLSVQPSGCGRSQRVVRWHAPETPPARPAQPRRAAGSYCARRQHVSVGINVQGVSFHAFLLRADAPHVPQQVMTSPAGRAPKTTGRAVCAVRAHDCCARTRATASTCRNDSRQSTSRARVATNLLLLRHRRMLAGRAKAASGAGGLVRDDLLLLLLDLLHLRRRARPQRHQRQRQQHPVREAHLDSRGLELEKEVPRSGLKATQRFGGRRRAGKRGAHTAADAMKQACGGVQQGVVAGPDVAPAGERGAAARSRRYAQAHRAPACFHRSCTRHSDSTTPSSADTRQRHCLLDVGNRRRHGGAHLRSRRRDRTGTNCHPTRKRRTAGPSG